MNLKTVLTTAAELLSDELQWTQHDYFKDEHGQMLNSVGPKIPAGVYAVCAVGACAVAADRLGFIDPLGYEYCDSAPGLVEEALREASFEELTTFNDFEAKTKSDVIERLRYLADQL